MTSPTPALRESTRGRIRLDSWKRDRRRWLWAGGGFAASLLFGALYAMALQMEGHWDVGLPWELALMRRVDPTLPRWLDTLMLTIPWAATNITVAPFTYAACVWLWRKGRHDLAVHLAVVQTGSFALNFATKFLFDRARPELWEKRGQFSWASYPSGHAITTVAVLFTVAYMLERDRCWRWPYAVITAVALITVWSRLYLGVHWPTDVIGGGIMGAIWLGATLVAFARERECGVGEVDTE